MGIHAPGLSRVSSKRCRQKTGLELGHDLRTGIKPERSSGFQGAERRICGRLGFWCMRFWRCFAGPHEPVLTEEILTEES